MTQTVYSYVQVEGLHKWGNCPIDEVSYLRDLHRHTFHIKCYKTVYHDDRDIEFIQFQHTVKDYLQKYFDPTANCLNFGNFNAKSIQI